MGWNLPHPQVQYVKPQVIFLPYYIIYFILSDNELNVTLNFFREFWESQFSKKRQRKPLEFLNDRNSKEGSDSTKIVLYLIVSIAEVIRLHFNNSVVCESCLILQCSDCLHPWDIMHLEHSKLEICSLKCVIATCYYETSWATTNYKETIKNLLTSVF